MCHQCQTHVLCRTVPALDTRPVASEERTSCRLQAPPLAAQAPAACYVCQLAATPGRFLPEKAAALGVPKGPLFGRLKAGQPVQAADGRTVQPSEVCARMLSFCVDPSCGQGYYL